MQGRPSSSHSNWQKIICHSQHLAMVDRWLGLQVYPSLSYIHSILLPSVCPRCWGWGRWWRRRTVLLWDWSLSQSLSGTALNTYIKSAWMLQFSSSNQDWKRAYLCCDYIHVWKLVVFPSDKRKSSYPNIEDIHILSLHIWGNLLAVSKNKQTNKH